MLLGKGVILVYTMRLPMASFIRVLLLEVQRLGGEGSIQRWRRSWMRGARMRMRKEAQWEDGGRNERVR
jgi:hypothetical protein